jgi:hypothetical protein
MGEYVVKKCRRLFLSCNEGTKIKGEKKGAAHNMASKQSMQI